MKFLVQTLLSLSVILGGSLSFAGPSQAWNFTLKDYDNLKKQGRELHFSSGSSWLPAILRENLLNTLKYVLDKSTQPSSTEGINLKDFYHGHILCKKTDRLMEIQDRFKETEEAGFKRRDLNKILVTSQKIPKDQIQNFQEALQDSANQTGQALNEFINSGACQEFAVLYHTFEFNQPKGMALNDPRRHLRLKLGETRPTHLHPNIEPSGIVMPLDSEIDTAIISNFGFLISKDGEIFVTIGSKYDLILLTNQ